MKYQIYIIFLFIIIITIILYFINNYLNKKSYIIENYCKVNNYNNFDGINDKKVLLDYAPQENITTSSCEDYWKEDPVEHNNDLITQNPVPIDSSSLILPKEKQFGDNSYAKGLINFKELATNITDNDNDFLMDFKELLKNPLTQEDLQYKYELDFQYKELNDKSWINRWKQFNPVIKNNFDYNEIKSSINNINILNAEFIERINIKQKNLLDNKKLLLFGLNNFEIFKYRVVRIEYNKNYISYTIEIALYRSSDLYINVFSYIGCIKDGVNKLYNVLYIGGNSTDNFLLADFSNKNELKQEIINNNYSNKVKFERNASAIIKIQKEKEESFKLKNQYGCFNLNDSDNYLLPYYTKESCESMYDEYGKSKPIGIYDSPCKKNEDCPFYKLNKNYENEFGKCLASGYCQLPSNMESVGYHYFRTDKKPLCYNCLSNSFEKFGDIDTCCDKQNDKNKFPYLKSPDYAFEKDLTERHNYYSSKHCYKKYEDETLICDN
jgi:hypothetical protein